MDEEQQEVITQMSLLLTQVRYARRAIENIELATTRYAGLALRVAGGPGAAPLGAPPMIDGALKVYVVNINDLTTGGPGIGDMLRCGRPTRPAQPRCPVEGQTISDPGGQARRADGSR